MCAEEYLLLNLNRRERSLLAQLRCGILPLRIETGRFRGEKVDDRLCTFCRSGAIEDEYHFLFNCPAYVQLREHLMEPIRTTHNLFDDETYAARIKILCSNYPRQLSKFICKAYEKRIGLLYVKG